MSKYVQQIIINGKCSNVWSAILKINREAVVEEEERDCKVKNIQHHSSIISLIIWVLNKQTHPHFQHNLEAISKAIDQKHAGSTDDPL